MLTHDTSVGGATFSPSGRLIATIAEDRNQHPWDAETGEPVATLVNLDVLSTFGASRMARRHARRPVRRLARRVATDHVAVLAEHVRRGPVEIFFNELYYPGLAG